MVAKRVVIFMFRIKNALSMLEFYVYIKLSVSQYNVSFMSAGLPYIFDSGSNKYHHSGNTHLKHPIHNVRSIRTGLTVTIKYLTTEAGVSSGTVSSVFNPPHFKTQENYE